MKGHSLSGPKVIDIIGGAEGDRTPDLMTASHLKARYQLSSLVLLTSHIQPKCPTVFLKGGRGCLLNAMARVGFG